MSGNSRLKNGRFAEPKVIKSRATCLQALALARSEKQEKKVIEVEKTCEGFRVVNLKELGKNMTCFQCEGTLSLANIKSETREGLFCILKVACLKCGIQNVVHTGKKIKINNAIYSDVNLSAVLGTMYSGMGCAELNKLLSCLDLPGISMDLYKRYEAVVGPAIEKAAKDSCKRAAEEERKLVIENLEKLCDSLPPEIFTDVYSRLQIIKSKSVTVDKFDTLCGEIINIIVSYDMGWSKRGNGRSYDSLNGYAAIIGFLSQKVLDYTTRNRQCAMCDNNHDQTDHDCRKNHTGSAKSMEASAGVQLINQSKILAEVNLNVSVVIGDDDSSTIAAIRQGRNEAIHKLSDKNHLVKNFVSDLYGIANNSCKELKKVGVIPHIKKCFQYAISQNKGQSADLAKVILSITDHFYNQHENCGPWCRSFESDYSQTIILKDQSAYEHIKAVLSRYASKSAQYAMAASSQANESLNSIICSRARKSKCRSKSAACDYRVASSVLTKNEGDRGLVMVANKLQLETRNMLRYCEKSDNLRKRKSLQKTTRPSKLRRIELTAKRINSRKQNEKSEGVTYQRNVGINSTNTVISASVLDKVAEMNDTASELVFFDLKTSGLEESCDILQIAAASSTIQFCTYALPTRNIPTQVTIKSIDSSVDTLRVFRMEYPERKISLEGYKLGDLAHDFLGLDEESAFHEALFDVQVLQELVDILELQDKLFANKISFYTSVKNFISRQSINSRLGPLKNIVSAGILQKMSLADINFDSLLTKYESEGSDSIVNLLSEKSNTTGKPIVTKDKKNSWKNN